MDKKNTFIGVALFIAAFGLFWYNGQEQQKFQAAQRAQQEKAAAEAAKNAPATPAVKAAASEPATPTLAGDEQSTESEKLVTLENGVVRYTLTTRGGAVKTAALLRHAEKLDQDAAKNPVLFNEYGDAPALALVFPDAVTGASKPWFGAFTVKEQSASRIVFEGHRADGLTITREYTLTAKDAKDRDPHLLGVTTKFRRTGGVAAPVKTGLSLGSLPPVEGDHANQFLNASAYTGETYEKRATDLFKDSSGFLGFGAHKAVTADTYSPAPGTLRWVAVSNQHFAGIATFDEASRAKTTALTTRPVVLPEDKFGKQSDGKANLTVTADAGIDLGVIAPGAEQSVSLDFFVGPKEYNRLAGLGDQQDKVIQFMKFFGFISINWLCKLLVAALGGLHWITSLFGGDWAWGLAIVALTCIIKGLTWPLTGMQMRAAEKMKSVQPHMEEIKKKYENNPQKMQQEMMQLYAKHKVNPFAGCLPILIQMPIFTGLYVAFQTCSELRHQPFLWISDLSVADTIPGLPTWIHILPLLMGLAMFANMRLTPMTSTDPNQTMMFYMLMLMFPIICYTSPAGLTTYWTVNSLLTLLQTWMTKRKQAASAGATGDVELIPPTKAKLAKKK